MRDPSLRRDLMSPHAWRAGQRRAMRWALAGLAVAIACVIGGCSGSPPPTASTVSTPHNVTLTNAQKKSIHIATLTPSTYHTTITTTGEVDFDHNRATKVVAPFSGAVTNVLVTLGQKVDQGQALAKVHSSGFATAVGAYRKAVLEARAADSIAKNDLALYAQHAISQRENAQAQASAAGADADRAAARQALVALHMDAKAIAAVGAGKPVAHGQAIIRAPISGTVVAKSIVPGQTLAVGTTQCFTIADTSRMWVMARLFGGEAAQVRTGDQALVVTGDGGKPLHGTVTNVGAVVNPETRSVAARIALANPDGSLRKGMFVQARIRSHAAHSGILVPDSAVLRDEENLPFVYVVAKGGGYARQRVTLGPRIGKRLVVTSGLDGGEQVVVDGSIFLRFIETQ